MEHPQNWLLQYVPVHANSYISYVYAYYQNAGSAKIAGESALHVACYMGSASAVKVLQKKGADVNKFNKVCRQLLS